MRSTFSTDAHVLISQNITGVNIKQINIAPTLSIFGPKVLQLAADFQQYSISDVHVHFLALDPVNTSQAVGYQELVYVY